MVPDFLLLYAIITVLFSLAYFFLASLPFLLVRLDIPDVSRLFRGLFNVYFWMVAATGLVATTVFVLGARLGIATELLVITLVAILMRKRVLQWIDGLQILGQSGDTLAMRRLRKLHWSVMTANLAVLGMVISSLNHIL